MGKNGYGDAVDRVTDTSGVLNGKREPVLRELRKVGETFISAIRAKKSIDTLRFEVDHFGSSSTTYILKFFLADNPCAILSSLFCTFEEDGVYPCVLSAGTHTVICSKLAEVKKELVSFCAVVGYKLLAELEKVRLLSEHPVSNPNGELAMPGLSGNPTS